MSLVEITGMQAKGMNVEQAVRERYSAASKARQPALCCPIVYEQEYLKVLPQELIDRDYGCGDPSKYVNEGETVLDLGSGGGKICYIASQIVGPQGRVLGVDMNDDMLALARKYQSEISARIGWSNVEFFKGRIQDLALDHDRFAAHLKANPIADTEGWTRAQQFAETLRTDTPMIASNSVDIVLSNCVLNLVEPAAREQLFAEVYRVLKPGGRAVISDIVCDQVVPEHLKNNPELWSGCISGAFVEHEFLQQFERAGFLGIEIVVRQAEPWATLEGIEFRSVTVRAFKGKDEDEEGASREDQLAVIYRGPWKSVTDDAGGVLQRGLRTAVSRTAFDVYTAAPYAEQVIGVSAPGSLSPGFDFEKTLPSATGCCGDDRERC